MTTAASIEGLEKAIGFVEQYYLQPPTAKDIRAVPGIQGALCLDTGKPGPTVAINAMMHLSEPAGLAAQESIIARWEKGERPPSGGKIYLTLGHTPDAIVKSLGKSKAALEKGAFIHPDANHIENRKRLKKLCAIMEKAEGRILDIHSTPAMNEEPMTMAYFPVPNGERWKNADRSMAATIEEDGIDKVATAGKMAKMMQGMPVQHAVLDYYEDGRANPILRSWFGNPQRFADNGFPMVLESGGPNLDPECRNVARYGAQAWLQNVMGWKSERQMPTPQRFFYAGVHKANHPSYYFYPDDGDEPGARFTRAEIQDTYYPLTDPGIIEHIKNPEHRKLVEIAFKNVVPPEQRAGNFKMVQADQPIAIGGNTQRVLMNPKPRHLVFSTGLNVPFRRKQPAYLLVTADERFREKELLPDHGRPHDGP